MTKTEMAPFRELLLVLQARVRGDVEHLKDRALDGGEAGGDSRSPTHLAELGSQAWEQDFSLQIVENDQEMLEEIEAALKRIEDGTYGQCESCLSDGKSEAKARIPKSRLKAIPYTHNCVACERKREELSI